MDNHRYTVWLYSLKADNLRDSSLSEEKIPGSTAREKGSETEKGEKMRKGMLMSRLLSWTSEA